MTAIACVALTAAGIGAADPAQAAPPQPSAPTQSSALAELGISVAADGWITYGKPQAATLGLTNSVTSVVPGGRAADGRCLVAGKATPSKSATYSEQVGFNPKTCESRVLTGTLSAAAAKSLLSKSGLAGGSKKASQSHVDGRSAGAGAKAAGSQLAADYYYDDAYTVSQWIDPVNILITEQAVDLEWPLYGEAGWLYAGYPSYQYPYDGWSVQGPYFDGFSYYSNGYGDEANSHFINNDFAAIVYFLLGLSGWLACGAHLSTQADFYHDVAAYGWDDDEIGATWNDSVSGACSNLVHHAAYWGYGWW